MTDTMKLLTTDGLSTVPGLAYGFGQRVPGDRQAARGAARNTFKESGEVFFLRQVHGAKVVRPPWTEPPDADASLTDEAGALLAIETADCLPLLIVDPANRRVAAAHAGWRGTAARVAQEAVRSMVAAGSKPGQLLVALGPAIGPCCYEVGADVEVAFGEDSSKFFVPGPASRKHLDVVAVNRAQLEEAGVPSSQIESVNLCTRCRGDLFFSYRRDGANAGRMISVVGFSRSWSSL